MPVQYDIIPKRRTFDNDKLPLSLFKISSDGPNSVGFTKQQAFPLGRQDYHSELDGGPIAIYYSDNNMV